MLRRNATFALFALTASKAFALYDPRPDDALAAVQGEWKGSLTYRDYSQPDRMVTLPTRLFVALGGPQALVLHFIFDDGPSKTVFSYERMTFDFAAQQMTWASGASQQSVDTYAITSISRKEDAATLSFERQSKGTTERHVLVLSPQRLQLSKEEVKASGETVLRNRYAFARPGA
jgi:hypothetical protein